MLLYLIAATPVSADSQSGTEYTVQPWDGTVGKPALEVEGQSFTFTFVGTFKEVVACGSYTIGLADGIPGVIWWREAHNAWHPDYLLLQMGFTVMNIMLDEDSHVVWLIGNDLTPDCDPNHTTATVWIRKNLGDGTPGHYNSATSYHYDGQPKDARPIYESASDKH